MLDLVIFNGEFWMGIGICSVLFYIIIQLVQCYFLFQYKSHLEPAPFNWPFISIWVAARNEEANLEACLNSLIHLDYPKNKIQILIPQSLNALNNVESTDNYKYVYEKEKEINQRIIDALFL